MWGGPGSTLCLARVSATRTGQRGLEAAIEAQLQLPSLDQVGAGEVGRRCQTLGQAADRVG